MPKFHLKCIERFIETTYYTIKANKLAEAVEKAVNGDEPMEDAEDGCHEDWLDLIEADKDGEEISLEEFNAAKAPHVHEDPPEFSMRELATVLAALRQWQQNGMATAVRAGFEAIQKDPSLGGERVPMLTDIATDGQTLMPLSIEEIGALCKRLNKSQKPPELPTATCQHAPGEDCLICQECGTCRETLDDNEVCDECRAAAVQKNLTVRCRLCGSEFDPRSNPHEVVNGHFICCSENFSPEQLAERLDLPVARVREDMGIE